MATTSSDGTGVELTLSVEDPKPTYTLARLLPICTLDNEAEACIHVARVRSWKMTRVNERVALYVRLNLLTPCEPLFL